MSKILKYLPVLMQIAQVFDALGKDADVGEVMELRPSYKGRLFSISIKRVK